MGRAPHYKYWSPEQEPDPTENFVGVLTQSLRKPVYYHNLYYEHDMIFIKFEKFSCGKHYFNLGNGTINSFLYCFRNSMYNGYPRNNHNFSNKSRNKTVYVGQSMRDVKLRICTRKKSITER